MAETFTEPQPAGRLPAQAPAVVVVGRNRLADAVRAALCASGDDCSPVRHVADAGDLAGVAPPGAATVVLSAHDTWDDAREARIGAAARRLGHTWLAVRTELHQVIVGPLELPGTPGCHDCARSRRDRSRAYPVEHEAFLERHQAELAGAVPATLGGAAARLAASVAVTELRRHRLLPAAGGVDRSGTDRAVTLIRLPDLSVSRHRLEPDPECPTCGGLPADERDAAELRMESARKLSPGNFRIRDITADYARLDHLYVDSETGVVNEVQQLGMGTFPTVEARFGLPQRYRREAAYGHGFDVRAGRATALAEALERVGGWHPVAKRTMVRGSYRQLRADALNPESVGLYPPQRHQAGFRFQRYSDGLVQPWVWGYSFRDRRPVLVPENLAYYGTPMRRTGLDRPYVHEVSNGCAIGGSMAEAVLHGLTEVAERDGFLMTWLARLPVPRIDPYSARDHAIPFMAERLRRHKGYEIALFNTTMEQGIPSFWVMAVEVAGNPDMPKVLCSGGAGLDPEKAVISGMQELGAMIEALPTYYSGSRDLAERMVHDPDAVDEMTHHLLLYSHPAAFERFDFLLYRTERHTFADFAEDWRWPEHEDIREDAEEAVGRFLDSGLDVVVVDQTGPDHRRGGFHCVKVIVPGAVPMTFGHRSRRVDGLPRLLEVPRLLGYRSRSLTPAELNPHPHPFG
ncbi:TOMM precursor leader peptide-binding protein [Streptomyces sp. ODS05-4]|uniref:TOMM precursor leader peptide-binding protein n=1 Tax=Streptomyces sp. ODS05-4 TaxID=2944939 RepID=UPI00210ED943|nr:TOMM precursor leader peptide-binding protein [Streptomyces sp. ODS05-4]